MVEKTEEKAVLGRSVCIDWAQMKDIAVWERGLYVYIYIEDKTLDRPILNREEISTVAQLLLFVCVFIKCGNF